MKKIISVIMAILLSVGCLSACSSNAGTGSGSERFKIVTTIFPEYDWVMNVLGDSSDRAEVSILLDNGVDLHSFQPTAADILKIASCDLFIYVGGESDEWVDDALKESTNKDMIVINLLDVLGDAVKEEEVVEGMQEEEHDHHHGDDDHDEHDHGDEDHDHEDENHDHEDHDHGDEDHDHEDDDHNHDDHDHGDEDHDHENEDHDHEGHDHEEEIEYDEHVWLSLKNAAVLVKSISDALGRIDPAQADTYAKNASAYTDKIKALDAEYQTAVAGASVTTLLFGDRFPFRYLVDDYGLSYYAAFVGCSAETEASFETITFLAGKADELSLPAVMTIEGADHRIAETIVRNTKNHDQQILTMDSMQSTTAKDVQNGATYLSIMEKNLSVLKDALK